MLKTLPLVLWAGLLGGTGHVMLSKGMKTVGDLTEAPTGQLGSMVRRAVSSPWLLLGVALLAYWPLGEPITVARWMGIGFVVAGVALVSRT